MEIFCASIVIFMIGYTCIILNHIDNKFKQEIEMVYTQFFTTNLKGDIDTALGSDGVFILDGRNNLTNMIIDSNDRYKKMKRIHDDYIGYKIMKGNRFDDNNQILYTSF
jgi:hypothetical protein